MVILHLITTIERGGAEKQLLILANEQKRLGHEVFVLPLKGKLELLEDFTRHGCTVDPQLVGTNPLLQALAMRNIVKNISPEVIHAHLPRAELLLSVLKTKSKKIISKHNTEPFIPGGNKFLSKFLSYFVCKRVDTVVAISVAVKDFMVQSGEIPKTKYLQVVLYGMDQNNELDINIVDLLRNELNIRKEMRIFGTISRLVPQKDLVTQILAFNNYLHFNSEAILVVIGDGPLLSELAEFSQKLECRNKIIWYGKTANIKEFLQIFDVFLLSSLYEGLGLVLLEAIQSDVPILAANNSAIPEVLGSDFPGLFETSNWRELSEKMIRTHESKYFEMLLKAQELRKQYFDPMVMAKNIERIYEGVIQ